MTHHETMEQPSAAGSPNVVDYLASTIMSPQPLCNTRRSSSGTVYPSSLNCVTLTFAAPELEMRVLLEHMTIRCLEITWQWSCWRHCFGIRSFSRVKTQDPWSDDDNAVHCFLLGGVTFGEAVLWSGCCLRWWLECSCCKCFITSKGSLFLISLFLFDSWMCASLMSFDILLVQRLGVIGISRY